MQGVVLAMRCDFDYALRSIERTGPDAVGVIPFDGRCASEPTALGEGEARVVISVQMTGDGTSRVALTDGIAGLVSMRTDTVTTTQGGALAQPMVTSMRQAVETRTNPIVE